MKNFTPHKLVFYPVDTPDVIDPSEHTPVLELPPEPEWARLADDSVYTNEPMNYRPLGGGEWVYVRIVKPDVTPDPTKYLGGVVSQLYARQVFSVVSEDACLFFPDSLVRNLDGTVIGYRRLGRYMTA